MTARRINFLLLGLLGIVILLWIFWPSKPTSVGITHIDTVYLDKPLPILRIDSAKITLPYRVAIYKADSIARRNAEKQDIITSVKVERGVLTIDRLTPRGIGIREEHHLPELATIQIDGTGKAVVIEDKKAKRKRWWAKVGRKAAFVGVAVAGIFVGSKL